MQNHSHVQMLATGSEENKVSFQSVPLDTRQQTQGEPLQFVQSVARGTIKEALLN